MTLANLGIISARLPVFRCRKSFALEACHSRKREAPSRKRSALFGTVVGHVVRSLNHYLFGSIFASDLPPFNRNPTRINFIFISCRFIAQQTPRAEFNEVCAGIADTSGRKDDNGKRQRIVGNVKPSIKV